MVDNPEVDPSHYSSTCTGSVGSHLIPWGQCVCWFFFHELGHLSSSLVQSFSQPDIFPLAKSLLKVVFVTELKKLLLNCIFGSVGYAQKMYMAT